MATNEVDPAFLLDVFRVGTEIGDFMGPGSLIWRCDDEYAPLTVWINCNDLFWWGTADNEPLTPETMPELREAIFDVRHIMNNAWHSDELYCCRMRKMRPQGPCYKHIPKELWPLFDACGPERVDSPRKEE